MQVKCKICQLTDVSFLQMHQSSPPRQTSSGTLFLAASVGNTLCVAAQPVLRSEKRGSWDAAASIIPEKVSLLKNVLDLC